MTAVIVNAPPFVPVKPLIKIGTAPNTVEFECSANEVDASPEQDETTTETFCGTFTSYKPEVWTVTITAFPSYGANGLWNALRPLVGTVVDFEIRPDADQPISVTNPAMTGTAILKAFPFMTGSVGEPTSHDVELAVQGEPEFLTVPPAGLLAEEPGEEPAEEPAP